MSRMKEDRKIPTQTKSDRDETLLQVVRLCMPMETPRRIGIRMLAFYCIRYAPLQSLPSLLFSLKFTLSFLISLLPTACIGANERRMAGKWL